MRGIFKYACKEFDELQYQLTNHDDEFENEINKLIIKK